MQVNVEMEEDLLIIVVLQIFVSKMLCMMTMTRIFLKMLLGVKDILAGREQTYDYNSFNGNLIRCFIALLNIVHILTSLFDMYKVVLSMSRMQVYLMKCQL